jgi:hypothetical protein
VRKKKRSIAANHRPTCPRVGAPSNQLHYAHYSTARGSSTSERLEEEKSGGETGTSDVG